MNLARALYSEAEIVILDDPLSAVDAHVAERLFSGAILALKRRGTAVLLVTHALHFLSQVDHIYCMNEGVIREEGSYHSLLAREGPFFELVRDFGHAQAEKPLKTAEDAAHVRTDAEKVNEEDYPSLSTPTDTLSDPKPQKTKTPDVLMTVETRRTGEVKRDGT